MIGRDEEPTSTPCMPCVRPEWKNASSHWHHIGKPALHKEPIGRELVEVLVEVEVFTKDVEDHNNPLRAFGQARACVTLKNSINMTKAVQTGMIWDLNT